MNIINSKSVLNREIKKTLWDCQEDNIRFPKFLFFCEGIGNPTFKITIEKIEMNAIIDAQGRRWVLSSEKDIENEEIRCLRDIEKANEQIR